MTILIYIFCVFLFLFLFIVPKNKEKFRPLKKYLFNKFTLNENSLHKQGLFWFAILFPLYSSLCFIFLLGSEYLPRWDAIGFNNFLNIHKFSLGLLTLSPILGAFVVSAHRSIQTAKQIEVTEKKNKVDIYYTRRKFIKEQLSDIKTINDEKISTPNILYMKFFTLSDNYNENKETLFIDKLNHTLEALESSILKLISSNLIQNPDTTKISKEFTKNYRKNILTIINIDKSISQIKIELEISPIKEYRISSIINQFIDELNDAEERYEHEQDFPTYIDEPDYDPYEEADKTYEYTINNSFNRMVKDIILYIKNILDTLKDIYLILFNDTDFENDLPGLSHCYEHIKNWRQSGDRKSEQP
ncbi:TPA: hypothetical protein SMN15_002739 [Proteus mirabilis]|nr:hypothetical protein [Proteus mirabilis]